MKQKWLLSLLIFSLPVWAATPWQQVKKPIEGPALSIGGFSNGCIVGAQSLPLKSDNYQVMRTNKLRYFGHPELVKFIERMTDKTAEKRLGIVLIGDMGMPAGGRFETGHASHQTGLDVDVWLQLPTRPWSKNTLQNPKAVDLVDKTGKSVDASLWRTEIGELIKTAAEDNSVTRIFVHPAIKKQLCTDATTDRDWLRKVRPWFGHRAHMHVRIACPKGSSDCIEQTAPPKGDGCGEELTQWLMEPKLPSAKPKNEPPPEPPAPCKALLENDFQWH